MDKKDVFETLTNLGTLDYGGTISNKEFRAICGIEAVEVGTRDEFVQQELLELSYSDYIRNKLLNDGKYFKSTNSGYRVLLPSENYEQVMSYMNSADNKLKRGIKLHKNTPTDEKQNDNTMARMVMKQESIRRKLE